MTIAKVTIEPIENLTDWYKVTFTSLKNGIGASTTEMLCSGETLRSLRVAINQHIPPSHTDFEPIPFEKKD